MPRANARGFERRGKPPGMRRRPCRPAHSLEEDAPRRASPASACVKAGSRVPCQARGGRAHRLSRCVAYCLLLLGLIPGCREDGDEVAEWPEGGWKRHTIDDSSTGADGVRLGDLNRDGRLDIVSPWEQGGKIRVYLNPGVSGVRGRWPAVTVGHVGDPEDAFFADLDGDGWLEVVSSCEGETRSMFIHWAPSDPTLVLDPGAWVTDELSPGSGLMRWMYAFSMQIDGHEGPDLVAGGKGSAAGIGWFQAPDNPRDLPGWVWHPLRTAGWIMTLRPVDFDEDGDLDVLGTDRDGDRRGAFWLENPGPESVSAGLWRERRIGPAGDYAAMHNAVADLDGDGLQDVLVAAADGPLRFHRNRGPGPDQWQTYLIEMPDGTGHGKSVEAADVDLDGRMDIVVATARADGGKVGVFWLSHGGVPTGTSWTPTSISGPEGFIYDLMQLTDLDGDGDLDLITLEEKGPYLAQGFEGSELGVIWYENPVR